MLLQRNEGDAATEESNWKSKNDRATDKVPVVCGKRACDHGGGMRVSFI